jgi:hypothetical protein
MSDRLVDQNYPDTFVCELTKIERLGSNRRLVFTVPSADEPTYKSIVAKLIVPADMMADVAQMLAADAVAMPNDDKLTTFRTQSRTAN